MTETMTREMWQTLSYMEKEGRPLFPGVLTAGRSDPVLSGLERMGLIFIERTRFRLGKAEYDAGFSVTPSGRRAVEAWRNGHLRQGGPQK